VSKKKYSLIVQKEYANLSLFHHLFRAIKNFIFQKHIDLQ